MILNNIFLYPLSVPSAGLAMIPNSYHLELLVTCLFKVQGYLKVKGQRNKSSGGNTHLLKVNDGYYQGWALRDLR